MTVDVITALQGQVIRHPLTAVTQPLNTAPLMWSDPLNLLSLLLKCYV